MKDLKLSKYAYEELAADARNVLKISCTCNACCKYCYNKNNPFRIYEEPFRDLDEIKEAICLMKPGRGIRLNDSLPGRLKEGEALIHPNFFEILELIRRKFNDPISAVTNGIVLTEEFINKMKPYLPIEIELSYHTDNPKYWCELSGLSIDKYNIVRNSFSILKENGFKIVASLTPFKNLVGWDDIENTILFLKQHVDYITVWPPTYSKITSEEVKKILEIDFVEMSEFFVKMRKKYRIDFSLPFDALKLINFYPLGIMKDIESKGSKNSLWMFSEAAYSQASKILTNLNNFVTYEHHPWLTKNHTYGGNVVSAGLLMVNDFRIEINKALNFYKKNNIEIDYIVLPGIPFDLFGNDLTGENIDILNEEFRISVATATA